MRPSRGTAVAIALLAASVAAAGCGLGAGEPAGEARLTVTRDFGAVRVLGPLGEEVTESETVMRLLEANAEISTRFGGGFVQSIEGLEGTYEGGPPRDWFFFVNGVESPIGAAEHGVGGGDAVWWDYRDWSAAMRVPAVVGSWPQPFAGGAERPARTTVVCRGAPASCREVESRLRAVGALVSSGDGSGGDGPRVLVGPWPRLRSDPAAAQIESGPQFSGVFADFAPGGDGYRLLGLDAHGRPVRRFGPGAGLVAATRRYEAPPTWVVTGAGPAGVRAAAALLETASLRDRYAVAGGGGAAVALPVGR